MKRERLNNWTKLKLKICVHLKHKIKQHVMRTNKVVQLVKVFRANTDN